MQYRIYSVYDSKAEAFMQPFFMATNGQAIRAFTQEAENKESMIGKYPMDYTLFELGVFHDANAKIELLTAPTPLGSAQEYVTSRGQAAA